MKNIEEVNKGSRWKLPSKAQTPMVSNYAPELDDTPELDAKDTQYFKELIGMSRRGTYISRVAILYELSLLS